MNQFQPPPTFALPILVDEKTKEATFSPLWLRWFLDLVQWFNGAGGTSFDPTITVAWNQSFGERGFATQTDLKRLRTDAQMILANQVFGD